MTRRLSPHTQVALLLVVLGTVSTLYSADRNRARGGERNGFEEVKKPKLYFLQKKDLRGKVIFEGWGYVEPMEAEQQPGKTVFRPCAATSASIPRLAPVKDLREEDGNGDKGDGVCLSNQFHAGWIDPLGLWIEIYSVKESGPWGATLDTIISGRHVRHDEWTLPDTVGAEEWEALENNYGGKIPAGTYLGRYAFGHYFLVAASAADIHLHEKP